MTGELRRRWFDDRDRRILALAVPALAGLAVEPLYVLVDTVIVGHLGKSPLGGLALASTVLTLSFWLFQFLSTGLATKVAFRAGQGDRAGGARIAMQGLWLASLLGPVVAAAIYAMTPAAVRFLGGRGAISTAARTYLRISAVGIPFVFIALVGIGYFRGRSDTRTPMRVAVVANIVNVVLEVVLVYGFDTGVAGSAWGTVIAQAFAAGWFGLLLRRALQGCDLRPDPVVMRSLVDIAPALFLRTAAIIGVFVLATRAAARIGDESLGGHQIAMNLFTFLALSTDALAVAAQAMVGNLLGAGDRGELRAVVTRLIRLGWITGVALAVAVIVAAPFAPAAFTSAGDVRSRATVAMVLLGVMQIAGALTFVFDGVLFGAGDFAYLQRASFGAFLVFLPAFFVAQRARGSGLWIVWVGLNIWMLARLLGNWRRVRGARWIDRAIAPAVSG